MRTLVCLLFALVALPAFAQSRSVPCSAVKQLVEQAPKEFPALRGPADRAGMTAKRLKDYDWCRIMPAPKGGQAYYCVRQMARTGEAGRLFAEIGADMRRCLPKWKATDAGLGLPTAPLRPVAEDGIWSNVPGGRIVVGVTHVIEESNKSASVVSFVAAYVPQQKPLS